MTSPGKQSLCLSARGALLAGWFCAPMTVASTDVGPIRRYRLVLACVLEPDCADTEHNAGDDLDEDFSNEMDKRHEVQASFPYTSDSYRQVSLVH